MQLVISLLLIQLLSYSVASAKTKVIAVNANQTEITVTQDSSSPWKVGDTACLPQGLQQNQCGRVIKAGADQAVIRLNLVSEGLEVLPPEQNAIEKGEDVKRLGENSAPRKMKHPKKKPQPESQIMASPMENRMPSSPPMASQTVSSASETEWNVAAGVGVGTDYVFPMVHIERQFTQNYALGLMPFFAPGITAVGSFLTNTFSLGADRARGLVLQGDLGYYNISQTTSGTTSSGSSLSLCSLLGWGVAAPSGFNFLIGAGAQYLFRLSGNPNEINFSGLKPYFSLEAGYRF